nr:udp-glycosyltransferase 73c6 [Quercus suber]
MASQSQPLHFILFPLMAQGHMIPMIDVAKLLAQRGVPVSVITTTHNAARFETSLARAVESGLQIQVIPLQFPCEEAGIPEGCDNLDKLPSLELGTKFFSSTSMLQQPVEELFEKLAPRPSCIISDMTLAWTADIALKFHIPRISFVGVCCFSLLCWHNLRAHKVFERISSESEYMVVPGLPDHVEFTKSQLSFSRDSRMEELCEQMVATDLASSYGEIKPQVKEDEKVVKAIGKEETVNVESEKPKIVAVEEAESHKPVVAPKERNIDLQLDLEKTDRDSGTASVSGNNKSHFHHNVQKLQQQQSQHTHLEKIGN